MIFFIDLLIRASPFAEQCLSLVFILGPRYSIFMDNIVINSASHQQRSFDLTYLHIGRNQSRLRSKRYVFNVLELHDKYCLHLLI